MKLTDPSDDALNEAFAEYVCGLKVEVGEYRYSSYHGAIVGMGSGPGVASKDEYGDSFCRVQDFTSSANAVLPWLEKHAWIARSCSNGVHFTVDAGVCFEGFPFPKACVIALLRAHGVEIEFTRTS